MTTRTRTIRPPAPPYTGPPYRHSGNGNKPINRLVVHSTVSPCEPGGARRISAYFRSSSAGGSAQYVIDPAEAVQSAYDSVVCWHAPPNPNSLGYEMCDIPGPVPGDRPGTARWKSLRRSWRWIRPNQRRMLDRTARLVAHSALAYDVPLVFLGPAALRRGARGITTHANVSKAWGQSTHWDPGWWPRRRFMRLVKRHARQIKEQSR